MNRENKPLGHRTYGSIPHLPNSRIGEGDHYCPIGQKRIATEKARDRHDTIIVTEKLDGSSVGVAKINEELIPLGRAGYRTNTSKFKQHQLFDRWVMKNYERFDEVLEEGERLCGEWLIQAHGTRYNLNHEPFVVFDLMKGMNRLPFETLRKRVSGKFVMPYLVNYGIPISVEEAIKRLGKYGFHGALDRIEGVVYRVERKGQFGFICKWVRPDKKDGCFLEDETGEKPIWNVDIKTFLQNKNNKEIKDDKYTNR